VKIKLMVLVAMLAMTGQATAAGINKLPPDCESVDKNRRAKCVEVVLKFKTGMPSQQEFVLAAKKTFYRRNYVISSVQDNKVTGVYRRKVTMAMVLSDSAVTIRHIKTGRTKPDRIIEYLRNLQRDIIYELAAYFL